MLYLYIGFSIFCAVLEHRFPFRPRDGSVRVILNDLLYAALRLLTAPVQVFAYTYSVAWLATLASGGSWAGLAHAWPYWAQLTVAFLVLDFAHWVQHWVFHKVPLLWPIHAVHHGIRTMYWGATFRSHFLWMAINGVVYGIPAAVFGFGEAVLLPFFAVHFTVGMSQHANVGFSAGWLNHIFMLWEVHRWHHTTDAKYFGKNYGSVFSFWDRLLGTFYHPKQAPEAFGIPDLPAFPQGFYDAQLAPFQYRRLLAEERQRRGAGP